MQTRREMMAHGAAVAGILASAGLIPAEAAAAWSQAAFDAKTFNDAVKALGGSAPAASKDVVLSAPDIAENGAVVPLVCSSPLPGVKHMLLAVEKNPTVLSAVFDVSDAIEANFSTRVKMAQTSNVYAVAMMSDGKVLFTQKEVKVTLGGCGG